MKYSIKSIITLNSLIIGLQFLIGQVAYATIDIPPEGVYFKLQNLQSNNWIYSNSDGRFGHYRGGDYEDQYWTLIPGSGKYTGYFKLENSQSKNWIYSNSDGRFGHYRGGDYSDQYWKIIEGEGTRQGYFKLENYQSKNWIYSNSDGRFGHYRGGDYSDQYWTFIYEDMKIESVTYNLDQQQLTGKKPMVIAAQTLSNNSNITQNMSFAVNSGVQHTSSFEHSHGFSVTVGTEFSAGVPFIGEASMSVSVTTEHSWTFGEENTTTKNYITTFPVTAAPHTKVYAKAMVTQATLNVPYVMILKSKRRGVEVKSYGTWSGVTSWNLSYEVKEL